MRWRVKLSHGSESVVMSEPEGLSSVIVALTRHPELHGVIKEIKTPLSAYGSNGIEDGRREWIKGIEITFGCDAVIGITIEHAEENKPFELFYSGEVGIQTIVESLGLDHSLEFTAVQNGLWRKLMSRFETPVDIQSTENLDGNTVTVHAPEVVNLPTQAIRQSFEGSCPIGLSAKNGDYIQLGFENEVISEITERHIIPTDSNASLPVSIFDMEYKGEYLVSECRVEVSIIRDEPVFPNCNTPIYDKNPTSSYLDFFIKINEGTPIAFTAVDGAESTIYTYSGTLTLKKTDQVRIYGLINTYSWIIGGKMNYMVLWGEENIIYENIGVYSSPASNCVLDGVIQGDIDFGLAPSGEILPTRLSLTANTLFDDTQQPGFLTHDMAASICDRITDANKFYSELLGSTETKARTYPSNGEWWDNINFKGLHLRGYTLSEKKFFASMKDYIDGGKPLFNFGIGLEAVNNEEVIRLESYEHFYNPDMSVLLSNVQRIKRKYGKNYFNTIETGFVNGKTEDISGIDDSQKQVRASIFKNIGSAIRIACTWIAQGLTIEQARRTTVIKSADYKFDDNIFVVEVEKTGVEYAPKIDQDFSLVTNLLNSDTRYNKHHTPARMFLRWQKWVSGCLQQYIGSVFRFVYGEGNYAMTSTMTTNADNYGGENLAENADITVTSQYTYIPLEFEIDHYLTLEEFKIIDLNKNNAIGISQTNELHQPFFIENLQYEVMTGQIKIIGHFKDFFDIQTVPASGAIIQGGKIFDATFDVTFE